MRPRVLHVIQCLSGGGAGRSLLPVAAAVGEHRVVSLRPSADGMARVARSRGVIVVDAPERPRLRYEIEAADIVHVHFWNTPELYEVLTEDLPGARVLLWAHIGGEHPPHVLSDKLVAYSDMTVCASPYTMELPAVVGTGARLIPCGGGFAHLEQIERAPHRTFNVGYIGTVDFVKMHPRYVELSARIAAPDARFIVCGAGAALERLKRQVASLGLSDRFDFRGYVADVPAVVAELDAFGYPLCEDNYSATDLALQEVMYAGVPAVVMPYGGAQRCVVDGQTGLIARDEGDYARLVERLRARPDERERLGRAARSHAVATWSEDVLTPQWDAAYEELLGQPKRERRWRSDPQLEAVPASSRGAALLVESLGERAGEFRTSLVDATLDDVFAAERRIAAATPAMASAGGGGVLHYRRHFPDDPQLRLWSGLIHLAQGHSVRAAGEFAAAIERGFVHWRASLYLARAAELLGQHALRREAIARVPPGERGHALEAAARIQS